MMLMYTGIAAGTMGKMHNADNSPVIKMRHLHSFVARGTIQLFLRTIIIVKRAYKIPYVVRHLNLRVAMKAERLSRNV